MIIDYCNFCCCCSSPYKEKWAEPGVTFEGSKVISYVCVVVWRQRFRGGNGTEQNKEPRDRRRDREGGEEEGGEGGEGGEEEEEEEEEESSGSKSVGPGTERSARPLLHRCSRARLPGASVREREEERGRKRRREEEERGRERKRGLLLESPRLRTQWMLNAARHKSP
ncbi:hypothetical protein F2P81_021654 [Scophthalmus maximus]|uniref:Uncharacterized protein n=1 Tax=Scophthalmus maximus TaxID=52904 RepID=A0A6A4S1R5_SCOMX|nr:hypothetical protein F2P81_021654 [Scophthalmus maximus]